MKESILKELNHEAARSFLCRREEILLIADLADYAEIKMRMGEVESRYSRLVAGDSLKNGR